MIITIINPLFTLPEQRTSPTIEELEERMPQMGDPVEADNLNEFKITRIENGVALLAPFSVQTPLDNLRPKPSMMGGASWEVIDRKKMIDTSATAIKFGMQEVQGKLDNLPL